MQGTSTQNLDRTIPIQPQRYKKTLLFTHRNGQPQPGLNENNTDLPLQSETPIHTTTTYAVSDGSVKNGHGTFGWVQATNKKILNHQSGHVEGSPGSMNSFRAEAQGLADLVYNKNITSGWHAKRAVRF